jgi:serum/glucocorticoid-regulated kinase 2
MSDQDQISKTEVGTMLYYAPEIVCKLGYNKCIDFWTLGIYLYELAVFETPFKIEDIKNKIRFKRVCIEAETRRNWKNSKLSE